MWRLILAGLAFVALVWAMFVFLRHNAGQHKKAIQAPFDMLAEHIARDRSTGRNSKATQQTKMAQALDVPSRSDGNEIPLTTARRSEAVQDRLDRIHDRMRNQGTKTADDSVASDEVKKSIQAAFRELSPDLRECYESHLLRSGKERAEGMLTLSFTFGLDSEVGAVVDEAFILRDKSDASALVDGEFVNCVTDTVYGFTGPGPEVGSQTVTVTYPIVFQIAE